MITPQRANYMVCNLAYNRGLHEDILVDTYYSGSNNMELWYHPESLDKDVLKEMSGVIPAFEVDCLLQWLRAKGIIVFVVPYTDPKDSSNTLYEVAWKDHHTTWSGYPDYLTALNIGLYNALETIENG